jgi:phytoene dehydrogenase-like protein
VLILDQRPVPGGAAITTEFAPGFRAPTLSHALGPVSAQVLAALKLDAGRLEIITPDPALVSLSLDGGAVAFHQDALRTRDAIAAVAPVDAERWPGFLEATGRVGRLAAAVMADPPPPLDGLTTRDAWRLLRLGGRARRLNRIDLERTARWIPMAVADLASEWFQHDLVRGAIAAHAVFGNLAGPRSAGTGGMLLQRLAADPLPVGSSITVKGGPGALSRQFAAAAHAAGATIRTDARVARVEVERGQVRGVTLDSGETIAARHVLATVDPRQLFLNLLPSSDLPPSFLERMRHYRARGVTVTMNLALSGLPAIPALAGRPELARGRLLVAPGLEYLERAFDAAKYGAWSPEPWLDVALPTLLDPALAPADRHVMSVHAHYAPYTLRDGAWNESAGPLADAVMRVLDAVMPGIDRLVIGREIITPADLERRWGLSGGHIFHGEPAMDQSWVARPLLGWSRYATPIAGLFCGGAGTHPGGGLTGLSGLHAAGMVEEFLRSRRRSDGRSTPG